MLLLLAPGNAAPAAASAAGMHWQAAAALPPAAAGMSWAGRAVAAVAVATGIGTHPIGTGKGGVRLMGRGPSVIPQRLKAAAAAAARSAAAERTAFTAAAAATAAADLLLLLPLALSVLRLL